MTDNELILNDILDKTRLVLDQYGEENFYISFSGGMDSTVVSAIVDMARPGNRIPRVFADTGIELNIVRDFVKTQAAKDDRIVIIRPCRSIIQTLYDYGYPFKSKVHSKYVNRYQRLGKVTSVKQYLGERDDKEPWSDIVSCPKILRFQFTDTNKLKISDKCCDMFKKAPMHDWVNTTYKKYAITGVRREEGGGRHNAECLSFRGGKLKFFQPLTYATDAWERWLIAAYNIEICDVYYPPYNFTRTGCKGCPFNCNLQEELDTLETYFPSERKQCEIIWKPVYDEYRRLGYRLRKED